MKITDEHIKLLTGMARLMQTEENFGFVPEFNAKRPFGSSMRASVARDAWILLGNDDDQFDWDDEDFHEELLEKIRECTPVLKAILDSPEVLKFVGMDVST
jgi:hypothetical protein